MPEDNDVDVPKMVRLAENHTGCCDDPINETVALLLNAANTHGLNDARTRKAARKFSAELTYISS